MSKMNEKDADIIQQLQLYKKVSCNEKDHANLLKNKKIILYAAVMLEKNNLNIIRLCLDIIENFIANEESHIEIISAFGVYEAVESLSIRMRTKNEEIFKRSDEITEILRNSTSPAYNTRSKSKGLTKNIMYLLYIENLNQKNRKSFENALLKIKGIISFIIHMELKRCTLRLCPKIKIDQVVKKINDACKMNCLIVTRSKENGNETLCDITQFKLNKSYLEYLEDEIISPQKKAIKEASKTFIKGGNTIIKSISEFWNESFYW